MSVRSVCHHVQQHVPDFHDTKDITFARELAETARFGDLEVSGFRNIHDAEAQKQFCAVTVHLGGGYAFIAFRGTDGTLVGWREDFNMTLHNSVPAQVAALDYLQDVAAAMPRAGLLLGGHSKGGNLSVYSSVYAPRDIQDQIIDIYTFDGPGFHQDVFNQKGFDRVRDRIHVIVPQTSIVGMMMGHEVPYTVIHSRESGLQQHDPYSWQVEGPSFVSLERTTNSSRFVDTSMKDWMDRLTPEQQQSVVDTIFDIMQSTGAVQMRQLSDGWYRNAMTILRELRNVDKETRAVVRAALAALFKAAGGSLRNWRAPAAEPVAPGAPPAPKVSAKKAKKPQDTAPPQPKRKNPKPSKAAAKVKRAQAKADKKRKKKQAKGKDDPGMWTMLD